jgi:WhiB family transcriptional regulator, redox-sensing transcriptional regulator
MSLPTPRPYQRPIHASKRAALVRRIEVGWQDQALCRKFPDDDWFPTPATSHVVAELVEVCRRCPAQRSCLAAALAMGEEYGIWGGATEADRAYGVAALARGASVPEVLDQLTTVPASSDEHETKDGEAA